MRKKLIEAAYPLSPMQSGLLFQFLFNPESDAYFVQGILTLQGNIKSEILKNAWQTICDHYPILRTGFIWENLESPLQYVLESVEIPFAIEDWRNLTHESQNQKLETFIQADRQKGFDLSRAPLFRISLIQCAEDKYYLIWSQHHILTDGWCFSIILRNFFKVYVGMIERKEVHLKPSRTYQDYIGWLQQQSLDKAEVFWKNYLSMLERPTILSFKNIIEQNKNKDYDTYNVKFSIEETDQFRNFARENGLTLNTLIQGAVGTILKTYTDQQEIVMGITISGRNIDLPGIEDIIGLFINTLPLRITNKRGEAASLFLKSLQDQAQRLNDYAYTSLAQIQSWAKTDKSLFDIIFVFENYPLDQSTYNNSAGFTIEDIKWIEKTEYPLTITVGPGKQLEISLSYQTAHFNAGIIKRFSDHIKQILINLTMKEMSKLFLTQTSIDEIPFLTQAEKQLILLEWNDTKESYPKDKMIYQLFEEQVIKTPAKIAVVYENQLLSYQELNEKANQLAHYLRSLGVGADTLVAVAVDRSAEMMISLLGILKAGGAYVPLDPSYPQGRLQFILEDSNVPIIITDLKSIDLLPATLAQIVCLEEEQEYLKKWPTSNPSEVILPEHLAYVIYTSGSTGKPKGVMIGHDNLNHYINYCKRTYCAWDGPSLLHSAIAFDMSITSIFLPLVIGNTVLIAGSHSPIDSLQKILQEQDNFSFIKVTPTHLKALNSQLISKSMMKQKGSLIIGGEDLSAGVISFWREASPETAIFNEYGPTETTVGCCVFRVGEGIPLLSGSVAIGKPIFNTQMYILDGHMNPVPVGVPGEIYIGGAGLARGYLNRAELTADRFVPNPFLTQTDIEQGTSSLRLYRTGDLARYLLDGNMEFLGRIDEQVKIRGFRIELGEIESTLNSSGEIRQALVLAREDEPGDKKLVAYIVPEEKILSALTPQLTLMSSSGASFSMVHGEEIAALTENLRNHLVHSLPEYMLPSYFIYLDQIPVTPNGKIDRKALPAPDLGLRQVEEEYVGAGTELEQGLTDIWSEVLKVEKIGIYDNFFKLGGHSLLATQVISRIRHIYNIDIALRALFEHPTIATLSKDIQSLNEKEKDSFIPAIVPMVRGKHIPLSFAQARLWFIDQLLPNVALYNIPLTLKLSGDLKLAALECAFNSLVERHEVLRTIFPAIEGEAEQVILPKLAIDLTQCTIDLRPLDKDESYSAVERLAKEEGNIPFNLSTGPLLRVKLVLLSEKEHVLLVTMHHTISDGWSMGIFFKELSALYNAYAEDKEPSLLPLPIQYADFTLWQREWLQGEVLEKQLSYWTQQLAAIPELLELPTDKIRPKELSYQGASYHYHLSKEIKDKLNKLSQDNGTSLFMTLLAAFQILLYRYSGQKDIVVGSPIANRHYQEIEGLIGFFINTLAFRIIFEGTETFVDILSKVKETTLQAYQHQDVPFEQLVDHLNVTREFNRNPVFQVIFTLQNAKEEEALNLNNLSIKPAAFSDLVAKFDLSLNAYHAEEGIGLNIDYATDLFEAETIERMASHFNELLEQIIRDPAENIETYAILDPKEKHKILIEWNDSKVGYLEDKTLHQLFEEQVIRNPNTIAVVYEEQSFTYQELNERANQLAHYLRDLGVGADTLVAIAVDRSVEMIIGLLGILKAGGAYVPLDPAYPKDRLQFILEDTAAPVLLTQSSLEPIFDNYAGITLSLDQGWDIFKEELNTNLDPITLPHHLAYIIYTSGSTGKPKGVMVQHHNVVRLLKETQEWYHFTQNDVWTLFHSYAFDFSVWEIWGSLSFGGKLVIVPYLTSRSPEIFYRLLKKEKVTVLNQTPSAFYQLILYESQYLDKSDRSDPLFIRLVIFGGEVLEPYKLKPWFDNHDEETAQLVNMYGITETTVHVTYLPILKKDTLSKATAIGKRISDLKMYILDVHMNPVPIGIAGEIYVGGAGLARGYLNRAELTADRFVPNPFLIQRDIEQNFTNLRLYRTGDLARYLLDGNIEFLGRIDEQVKIRGFRIELGEIESTLNSSGEIRQALVLAREDEPGDKKLVAYIVPEEKILATLLPQAALISSSGVSFSMVHGEEITALTEDLRNHLVHSLPEYMLPSYFIYLDQIPVTPNGKIDRKALPAPDLSLRQVEEEYVGAGTELEQGLTDIWSEVLKVEKIGIYDNFFKLGGHSLLATQVISRIRHIYNIDIALRALFEHPTIATLSKDIQSLNEKEKDSFIPAIVPMVRGKHIPLSFAQARLWFIDQLLPNVALYNIPLTLKLSGDLKLAALECAFNSLVERHEVLRTIFPAIEGEAEQVILPKLAIDLTQCTIDLRPLDKDESYSAVERLAKEEGNIPFNLSTGPLLRVKLVLLSEKEHVLLVTMHHTISDGWSMGIFFKELSALYNAYAEDKEPSLLPLPIQYADFTLWQREWLQGEVLEKQLSYWTQQLAAIPELLELPTDKIRPKELSYQGASYHYHLSKEIKDKLNKLSQDNGTSLFMTLLAAFQILLYRYSGQKDIVVGSPIANRHYQEIEGLIGFFINTLAFRIIFEGTETFVDILSKVKETTLQAYQHQDVPFEQLVDHLNVTREFNRNPVFQVIFTLQNAKEEEALNLNNLSIKPAAFSDLVAKFDLSLNAYHAEEGIGLNIDYATDLFEAETIERMASHFNELLEQIIRDPAENIETYAILDPKEKHKILIEWNDSKVGYLEDKTLHQLFEEQVIRNPNTIAVVYEEQSFTYQELNERANQLAHYLRDLGVGADTLVAIAVDRSVEMIIGLLGILKAGGAYVPLDPAYPKDRLQFILEDTAAPVLLTQSSLEPIFDNYAGITLSLDQGWDIFKEELNTNLDPITLSHHLAYIIYTSGSTGKPKGVMVQHHNVVRLLKETQEWYHFTQNDVWTLFHSYAFDFSVWEIWGSLSFGGKLVIVPYLTSRSPEIFYRLLKKEKVTVLNQTPSAFYQLILYESQYLDKSDRSDPLFIRLVIFGGEVLEPYKLKPWFDNHDEETAQLVNMYGITETTVHVTYLPILKKDALSKATAIGKRIPDLKMYILDVHMNPVPIGIAGEIYVGGAGLARGYLNRAELTADRFVPNPFLIQRDIEQNFTNLRLYRTGDLARYLLDGNIEFLGRIDEQVKIRGFRIELGEIESTLNSFGEIRQALVLAREDEPGDKKLVAYIVPEEKILSALTPQLTLTSSSGVSFSMVHGEEITALTEDLRNHLVHSLPEYMLPAFFIYLDQIPVTPNGKIDRKALPAPDLSLRQVEEEYVGAGTELEQGLTDIWSEVLKVEKIGIYDNFFKLGGHSLLATQVISRIRHIYNIDIALRALFEHPTIATLSKDIQSLNEKEKDSFIPAIVPVVRDEHIPLSFAQARLWFIDQLLPNVALYNIPLALKLSGDLKLPAFELAFNKLVERHEVLRTIFPAIEGEAEQVILPKLAIDFTQCTIDLRPLDKDESYSAVERLAKEEGNIPFNLSTGPLLRVKLVLLSEKEHVLLVTMHHTISDGWSMGIFFKELSALYNAYAEDKEPSLLPLPIQYADFTLWQREWLQGEVLEKQLSYWKQQLAGIPDLLELPTDKIRPKELSYQGASYHYSLSKEIKDKLNKLSQDNGTSLFMTLLAAFQILLYRYSGQKDIVVGSPIANRHYQEIEGLIGFFINTLALRTTFEGTETFVDILSKVKETTLQAYQHQDVPFEQLVDHLNVTREFNRNPVFQVIFTLQNAKEEEALNLNNLSIKPAAFSDLVAKFDLSLNAYHAEEGIGLNIDYATDLFEAETIERMASHFNELLEQIIRDPAENIETYAILDPKEKHKILIEWNDSKVGYLEDKTLHQLFEEQVIRNPNTIAVVYEEQSFTYQELNERANQLAHYLRDLGVGADTLVAIAVDRSVEMIIGLLGILKAGGAYVPLDPAYPKDRLQFILEDTAAPVLLTQSSLEPIFDNYAGITLSLDQGWDIFKEELNTNLDPITLPHHLAYIIYTSGSTGKPKGVMVQHHNVVRLLKETQEWYHFTQNDVWTLFHSYAFDFSVWEIWGSLSFGGKLVIVPYLTSRSPEIFYRLLKKEKVTVLNQTPSAFYQLILYESQYLDKSDRSDPLFIRLVIFGGEVLEPYKLKPWFDNHDEETAQLVNMYGITETTVHVTYLPILKKDTLSKATAIGKRIPDLKMYILDVHMNPVPIGIAGEIYVGGAGLARGYLNRAELTADRFVPNPFLIQRDIEQNFTNLRLYRTGDLARYLLDGNIEFLGRIDEQVKIRGFRIELGEIESTLNSFGEIRQALVLAREDEPGDKKLVAYIVPEEKILSALTPQLTLTSSSGVSFSMVHGEEITALTEDLRNHLVHSLPEYMLPAFFIYLDQIPVTPNGKIDRKALPAPDLSLRQVEEEYVGAGTELEQGLTDIWSEVLKVEKIGIYDNFFKLGGHSLLATQVISRIRHIYNIDIALRALFEHPTIATLSKDIQSLNEKEKDSFIPAIVPMVRGKHIPLSFAQARLWFIDQLLPNVALYNIPLALKLSGDLKLPAFELAFNKLVERHEVLRTIFPVINGEAEQVILPKLAIDFTQCTIDLRPLDKDESYSAVERLAKEEGNIPFNLSTGPLLRVKLVLLSEKEHVLLVTMHHTISDGWSMGIFFKELSALYNAYAEDKEPSLLPLPIQYADFTLWQREWLQGEVLEKQLSYWKQQLAGIPDLLELPTDKIRPKELSYQGASYHYSLSKEIKDELNKLSQDNGTSLFMTLLAAFQILLYRYSGQKDIVVGSPIANRHYQEIEGLIGFFINTLALRITFEGTETFVDILSKVKETTLQAYQHQDIYFDQLIDSLEVRRVLNRNPVFQVEFTLQNAKEEEVLNLNNLSIKPVAFSDPVAKFDLSLNAYHAEEGIGLNIDYATDLFEAETIERMASHFNELLEQIIRDPVENIETYAILDPKEKHKILIEWNDSKVDYEEYKPLHQLFEEQVIRNPNTIAVVYEEQSLTYQELNERANQFAHYLKSLGVESDTLVAIAMEKSLEMIIGLLGILKAGGVYVPLDPSYPQERQQFILEDTNALIVVTDTRTMNNLPSTWAHIICLDEELERISKLPLTNLNCLSSPRHLAYVIYTSGSTGKPKGVMIENGSFLNHMLWMRKEYHFSEEDTILQRTSCSFDASVWELFVPLISGSKMVIAPSYVLKDFRELSNFLLKHKVNTLQLVPSALVSFLQASEDLGSSHVIKHLFVGGESLSSELSCIALGKLEKAALTNLYGPTEATIDTLSFSCKSVEDLKNVNTTPIGKPISNVQTYILDASMNPVPVGIAGEIYIGGIGLARGYLNRAELTADRFVPNPFLTQVDMEQGTSSLRLYRTGDLARYLLDGNIEFLGRIDEQVKIRGFRIELGEIESVLNSSGELSQALVMAREDEPGDKKLVAYIVPEEKILATLLPQAALISSSGVSFSMVHGEGVAALTENLRNHLSRSLPEYMLPSFFIYLDQIPVTPNGKIDRKALPAPDLGLRQVEEEYIGAGTELEQGLIDIWSEVLKVEKIGIYDNFFKLGGHSLLATQVISRIRHIYNIDIALRALFEHPTIATLSKDIQSLNEKEKDSFIPAIVPMVRDEHIPLSFAQARLWFIDQLLPNVALYNIPLALKLNGALKLPALELALNSLVERHEILRTIFPAINGEAEQVVLPKLAIDFTQCSIDLKHLDKDEKTIVAEQLIKEEANLPFNLSTGPLLRVKLVLLSEKEHMLLMTLHHIISDAWSTNIFFKEFISLYNAYSEGKEPFLLPLPIQYADFTLWQRGWFQGKVLEKQLSYWKQQLAGIPDLLELPTDKIRPKELTYQGATYHYHLSKEIKDELNKLSQDNGTSLFMTLLAAFQIFLYRYSGQNDIVVGSPIANRHYQEIEGLIGFFINTLALRTTFEGTETFVDTLSKVKETTLEAYQHQDIPLDQLIDHLEVPRVLNRNPVFQVEFSLESVSSHEEIPLNNLSIEFLNPKNTFSKFDLRVLGIETKDALSLNIEYSEDLFDCSTIERLAIHFEELLKNILKNPNQLVSEYSLITSEENHQLLIEWNDTKISYPKDKMIYQLFEEQVIKTPAKIAVVYENQTLSYQELNEKANQFAHYLKSLGVGADTLVAVAVDRSVEMMISLLGILKAGGAYVPLDPSYPQSRLQFILEDSNVPIIITDLKSIDLLPATLAQVVCLEEEQEHLKKWPTSNPSEVILPEHLAYVIYTSGSTGKPKGVMIGHGNLNHYINYCKRTYCAWDGPSLLHSAIAFDMSITSIFLPLVIGNTVLIAGSHSPIDSLQKILQEQDNFSFIKVTPTHLKALNSQLISKSMMKQKGSLIIGGEDLSAGVISFWREASPETAIFNEYGPTETTVGCCVFRVGEGIPLLSGSVAIGKPIFNTQMYILDGYMNPVPVGIAGEIYIGGAGLARGYLNRAELTADRFVPNPFITQRDIEQNFTNLRLYRTGDLARYLLDGNIEFLGRIDEQVKIRGFRIELGEIESTLNSSGEIRQALVLAREDEPGDKKLVAYIVPDEKILSALTPQLTLMSSSGASFSMVHGEEIAALTEDLRNHLGRSLPEYMLPAFFIYLDQIPVTPNGKIDRKALPAPDLSLRQVEEEYVGAGTELEQGLIDIWSEVLKVEKIGIYDNFFKLGGDSIISIQIVSKARSRGIYFAVRDIFSYPTIASLSSVAKIQESVLSFKAEQGTSTGEVPLTPIQHWFFNSHHIEYHHFNQATLLLVQKPLDLIILNQALSLLLLHHDALRLRYTRDSNQQWRQHYCLEDNLSCTTIDFSMISENNLALGIEKECSAAQQDLDIEKGPILKAVLFDCGQTRPQRLFIVIHHLVVDGVSWRILIEDLTNIYSQLSQNKTPALPPKTHSYQQWAKALTEYATSTTLEKEIPYWQKLEDSIGSLPVDFDHGPATSAVVSTINITLTVEETRDLLQRVPKAYRTQINDILLTALTLAIGDWTKEYRVVFSLEGHGREDIIAEIDLSRTVGWFTSIFPTYLRIKNPEDLSEAITTVKESLREIPHKGIGYGILSYLRSDALTSSSNPDFVHPMLSFNYLGQWDSTASEETLFTYAEESAGSSISDKNNMSHLLSINGEVRGEALRLFFSYSRNHYCNDTIQKLADNFSDRLKQLIQHCCQENTFGYTRSDFKLSKLDSSQIKKRMKMIEESKL